MSVFFHCGVIKMNTREELLDAAYNKNHAKVVEILKKHKSVSNLTTASYTSGSWQGYTALHCAVYNSCPETIKALLEAGASIYAVDGEGNTPMDVARKYKCVSWASLVTLCIKKDNEANQGHYDRALGFAIFNDQPHHALKLVEANADLYFSLQDDANPLYKAIIKDWGSLIEAILKSPRFKAEKSARAFDLACAHNRSYLVQLLKAGIKPNWDLIKKYAADKIQWEKIRLIINNLDTKWQSQREYTSLSEYAVLQNKKEELDFLLKKGAALQFIEKACETKHWDCVRTYLDNVQRENLDTEKATLFANVLFKVSALGPLSLARRIILYTEGQINLHAGTIHAAIERYNEEPQLLVDLLKAGFSPNPANLAALQPPLTLAFELKYPKVISLLLDHHAKIDFTVVSTAAKKRHWECVFAFLQGVRPSKASAKVYGALLFDAIEQNNADALMELFKAGADICCKNTEDRTPVEEIVFKASADNLWYKMLSLFLDAICASHEIRDQKGFDCALSFYIEKKMHINVDLLMQRDPTIGARLLIPQVKKGALSGKIYPLHLAILTEDRNTFDIVLQQTKNHINLEVLCISPLALALERGIGFATILLDNGAKLKFADVLKAAENGHWDLVKEVWDHPSITDDFRKTQVQYLIFTAVTQKNVDVAGYFQNNLFSLWEKTYRESKQTKAMVQKAIKKTLAHEEQLFLDTLKNLDWLMSCSIAEVAGFMALSYLVSSCFIENPTVFSALVTCLLLANKIGFFTDSNKSAQQMLTHARQSLFSLLPERMDNREEDRDTYGKDKDTQTTSKY